MFRGIRKLLRLGPLSSSTAPGARHALPRRSLARASVISVAMSSLLLVPLAPANAAACYLGTDFTANTYDSAGVSYTALRFTRDCEWAIPTGVATVDLAIVGGGGGGGGGYWAAGGGAGEMVEATGLVLSEISDSSSVAVDIGAAGGGGNSSVSGTSGSSTKFGTLEALGGGGGGTYGYPSSQSNGTGKPGGSGGGHGEMPTSISGGGFTVSGDVASYNNALSASNPVSLASGTVNRYVNAGGSISKRFGDNTGAGDFTVQAGSGGGGAGGAGGTAFDYNGSIRYPGLGGVGRPTSLFGSQEYLAAGGGGSSVSVTSSPVASQASGIGGIGGRSGRGGDANPNTGSGGGGTQTAAAGGNGSAGVVILRYVTPAVPTAVQNFTASTRLVDADTDADSVTLTWDALTGQTPAVNWYEIQTKKVGTDTWSVAVTSTSTTAEIASLDDGETYSFRIRAVNDVGSGPYESTNSVAVSKDDYAMNFDGSATVNGGTSIIPTDNNAQFSVEAWVKPDSVTGYDTILTQQTSNTSSNYFYLGLYQTGTSYYVDIGRDTSDSLQAAIPDPTGKWMHIAVTVATNDNIELFVDGTLLKTFNKANAGTGPNFAIGSYVDGTYPFDGQIDQVKLWNDVRTKSEIAASMHAWGNPVSSDTSLISHYDFNDNTQTTTLRDQAGSNDLTYTSVATSDLIPLVEKDTLTRSGYALFSFKRSYLTASGGWTPEDSVSGAEALVVGGGGAGGFARAHSAGGGGGGEVNASTIDLSSGSAVVVKVGQGGVSAIADNGVKADVVASEIRPTPGQTSELSGITAKPGAFGSSGYTTAGGGASARIEPGAGGTYYSGGGNSAGYQSDATLTGVQGAVTFGGGAYTGSSTTYTGGGGGGAAGNGVSGSSNVAGNGGIGASSSITGSPVVRGGGGGGGIRNDSGTQSSGGTGGGGAGGIQTAGTSGLANSGGGGGAGGSYTTTRLGGNGGSGVVILAYSLAPSAPTITAVSSITATTASVAFTAPSQAPETITKYQWTADGSNWYNITGTSTPLSVEGLTPNTAYASFKIRAVSGVSYDGTASAAATSFTTLEAYSITYNANSATGGTVPSSQTKTNGVDLTLATNSGSLVRTGYTFSGWNTQADGLGTDYAAGSSYSVEAADELFAKWTASTVTVTFKSNFDGGAGDTAQAVTISSATNLTANAFTRTGMYFSSWNTAADGSGTRFTNSQSVTRTENLTLYAQWTNLLINLDGASTDSLANNGTSWTSVLPGSSGAVGSAFGNASYFTSGGIRGFSFDGNGDYVNFAAGAGGITGEMTLETWINPGDLRSGANPWNLIATRWFSNTSGAASASNDWHFAIKAVTSTTAKLNLYTSNSNDLYGSYTFPITGDDDWYLVGFTLDASGNLKFFVNGAQDGTTKTSVSHTQQANALLMLGDPRANLGMTGKMSKFRLYNKALSTSEMLANFDAEKTGFEIVEVNFDPNGGAESSYTQNLNSGDATNLVGNSFTRTNFDFTGWNTAANGSGTPFADAASVTRTTNLTLYAQWAASAKTVTYNRGDSGTGSDQTATKTNGVNLVLPNSATANSYFTRTGYTVTSWSTSSDGSTSDYALGASYATEADETLYPVWTLNSYTITFNRGSLTGSTGADQTTAKSHGVALALPDSATANTYFTKTGYTVTGWSLSADGSTSDFALGANFTANEADFVFPIWTPNTYTITFNKGSVTGATGVSGDNQTLTKTHDQALALPDSATANGYFTKTGYSVTAWSETASGSTIDYALGDNYTAEVIDTLYPVWTANTYTVTYNYNGATGGNSAATSSYTVDGIVVSLPTPTKTGYTFAGWYSNPGLTTSIGAAGASYSPSTDVTAYAKWSAATFTVIYAYNDADGGDSTASNTFTTGGTIITLPTPTRTGYDFGGWYSDSGLTSSIGAAGASYSPSVNLTIYAKWNAINYSVTYNTTNVSGGVTTSATGGVAPINLTSYNIGDAVPVSSNSGSLYRNGYTFAGWVTSADGTGTALNSGQSVIVGSADINFYPKWTANTYTYNYNLNGGSGDLSGAPTSWTAGTSGITLPSTGFTKTGYTFGGWSKVQNGSAQSSPFINLANATLYAVWNIKTISYGFDKGTATGLTIASWPANSSATFGSSISLPDLSGTTVTISGASYAFFGWSYVGSTYASGDAFVLGETAPTFTANWVQLFDVTYGFAGGTESSASGTGDTECVSGGLCTDGQSILLRPAPTRTGYNFNGWKVQTLVPEVLRAGGSAQVISATSYLFYAKWTAIDYSFSFDPAGGGNYPNSEDKNIGQLLTMPNPGGRAGYTFAGWTPDSGGSMYAIGSTYLVGSSGKSFVATWTANIYTVSFDWQGATGTPAANSSYTVGTGNLSLPAVGDMVRDGYTFSGWSESPSGSLVSGFQPTADDVLYAVWADGNYTLSYNPKGGTVGTGLGTVGRGLSVTLPTPVRAGFTFIGWNDSATGGTLLGTSGATFTPAGSTTLFARWVQNSLAGVDLATLDEAATLTIGSDGSGGSITRNHAATGTDASVVVPNGALPAGTVVTARYFKDTERQSSLIQGDNNYIFSLLISWITGAGDAATVPNTTLGTSISVTLNSPAIKAGQMVYQVIGTEVTELVRATVDGTVTIYLTEDPEIVVAATKPAAPAAVTAAAGDTALNVTWTGGANGGAEITSYTATAKRVSDSAVISTCTTAATSCVINGLVNNTAYTVTVTATNSIGASNASTASAAATPVGASYAVTFDSNGGSNVSAGSFFSGGSTGDPVNPSKSGYSFVGWSTVLDDELTKISFPYSPGVLAPITLYALWELRPVSPSTPSVSPNDRDSESSTENYSWTKRKTETYAKVYSKNVVGVGKVQFFLNGREIAWIRAVDESDPKLRTANGSHYLVRTLDLELGKNVIEIYVGGERVRRVAYTRR